MAERDFERSQTLAKSNAVSTAQGGGGGAPGGAPGYGKPPVILARIALSRRAREGGWTTDADCPLPAFTLPSRLDANYAQNIAPASAIRGLHDMSESAVGNLMSPNNVPDVLPNRRPAFEFTATVAGVFRRCSRLETARVQRPNQSIGQSTAWTLGRLPADLRSPPTAV